MSEKKFPLQIFFDKMEKFLSGRPQAEILEAQQKKIESIELGIGQVLRRIDDVLSDLHLRLPQIPIAHPPSGALDLRGIAEFESARRSSQYMIENFVDCQFFTDREEFLRHCVVEAGQQSLYLEFGVYSGASINAIADAACPNARIVGFDSFEGLPERWRPGFEAGTFQMQTLPEVRSNVELIKGWFDSTIPLFLENLKGKIGFVHVDCDLYSSTKTIFQNISDHLSDNAVIVFDEYFNYPNWENHEFKAFQEFIHAGEFEYQYIACVPINQQVAVRLNKIRPPE